MAGADVDVGTELRLGLPGGGAEAAKAAKRGYEDTIDLKLTVGSMKGETANKPEQAAEEAKSNPEKPPVPKAQAVGWPPVRSYRRNAMTVQSVKIKKEEETEKQQPAPAATAGGNGSAFVKVSMDGAPYLRKVDLKMYNTYKDLSIALQKMFSTFTAAGNSIGIRTSKWSWSNVQQIREISFLKVVELCQYFQDNTRPENNIYTIHMNPFNLYSQLLQVFNRTCK